MDFRRLLERRQWDWAWAIQRFGGGRGGRGFLLPLPQSSSASSLPLWWLLVSLSRGGGEGWSSGMSIVVVGGGDSGGGGSGGGVSAFFVGPGSGFLRRPVDMAADCWSA